MVSVLLEITESIKADSFELKMQLYLKMVLMELSWN